MTLAAMLFVDDMILFSWIRHVHPHIVFWLLIQVPGNVQYQVHVLYTRYWYNESHNSSRSIYTGYKIVYMCITCVLVFTHNISINLTYYLLMNSISLFYEHI